MNAWFTCLQEMSVRLKLSCVVESAIIDLFVRQSFDFISVLLEPIPVPVINDQLDDGEQHHDSSDDDSRYRKAVHDYVYVTVFGAEENE